MKQTLYWLRHGEGGANVARLFAAVEADMDLTPTGVRQIEAQAERLADAGLDAIYASPLRRTSQTAALVAARCGLEVRHRDGLWEVHVGELDGRSQRDETAWGTYEAIEARWFQGETAVAFPGGESQDQVVARFQGVLDEVAAAECRTVLLVGHFLLFKSALWRLCVNRPADPAECGMGRGHLSVLERTSGGLQLVRFNEPPFDGEA